MNLTRALICLPALFAINVLAASNTPAVPDAATDAAPDAHLDYPPGKAPKFWSIATAETIMARWPDYNLAYHASWTYVHGYALVLVETLADLPKNHAQRAEMEGIFRRLAAGLKRTQDAKSGRWFQVVDKGDRSDNWTDTSGSAMFTYTIQKGIELGLLDKAEYAGVVETGYQGITENAKINDKGLVDIYSACDGVGVQTSYDRYINYKKSINAKEAVAGFLWATALVEKPELEKLRK